MKRELTQREKVLMLFLAIVLLAAGYVKLFYEPLQTQMAAAETRMADAGDTVMMEQTKLTQLTKMQEELDAMQESGIAQTVEIPDYDNIDKVMLQLNAVLSAAADYQLTFSDVQFGDQMVLRPIQMTFTAKNYAAAKAILTDLSECRYRCSLSDLTVTAATKSVVSERVSVTLTVTFYERYDAAASAAQAAASAEASAQP